MIASVLDLSKFECFGRSLNLEEFVHDHHASGSLTADPTPSAWNGYLLTVSCAWGVLQRGVTPEDAELDLIRSARLTSR